MSRTYKTTGIILKAIPMGEADRLVTVLTPESGLVRAIAPGARKHKSRLGGRTGLFVINELLLSKGKSLDKIIQAETVRSFPALSTDLGRLTASQYLSELVLCEAVSEVPQGELYRFIVAFFERLEQVATAQVLAELAQAVVQVLRLGGVAPEVYQCCVTGATIQPALDNPSWRVGFSAVGGGVVTLAAMGQLESGESSGVSESGYRPRRKIGLNTQINASELIILQELCRSELVLGLDGSLTSEIGPDAWGTDVWAELGTHPAAFELWRRIERILRQYAQYHLDRTIRSAALIDTCFSTPVYAS
ncbi:MAG: DNA repair protein RecO [Cyanobacteria bacterium P01_A01_bin.105]